MADIVAPKKRSEMMAGIKGKNTQPELIIRKALHKRGYRYKLHAKDVFGKPDLVLPKYKAVIFVNGCFWHGHDCPLFKLPSTRSDFWSKKIADNKKRDLSVRQFLTQDGWRYLTIWECALKGRNKRDLDDLISETCNWLQGSEFTAEIMQRPK